VFGWLGDRIGRVKAMALGIPTYSLVTGLAYFAQTRSTSARCAVSVGMGGQWSLGVALVMECWPKWRPMLAGRWARRRASVSAHGPGHQSDARILALDDAGGALRHFVVFIMIFVRVEALETIRQDRQEQSAAEIFARRGRSAGDRIRVRRDRDVGSVQWLPMGEQLASIKALNPSAQPPGMVSAT
jgi:hypothetical protein